MYLISAKKLFTNNVLVSSMEMKFVNLIKESNDFISENLCNQSVHVNTENKTYTTDVNNDTQNVKKNRNNDSKIDLPNPSDNFLNSPLDEELCLTTEDWLYVDNLSVPRKTSDVNSGVLFDSMESQSKALSMSEEVKSSCLRTPVNASVFKVGLNGDIPVFDLGIEGPEEINRELICDQLPVVNANADCERPKRDRKITDVQKSPFFDRVTPIFARSFKKEESDMWNWLHSNKRNPK